MFWFDCWMSNRESGNRVSRAEMDVREISPRKPFGFPGEDGSRRCSRDEEEEEGRRRVGEEEEEDEEDEDRLDVVGLDECSSSRPGRPLVSQFACLSFSMCPQWGVQNHGNESSGPP